MPYYVYRVEPNNQLSYYADFPDYRSAKLLVNEKRKLEPKGSPVVIRMMHAKNQTEAERLLTAPRDDRRIGDD